MIHTILLACALASPIATGSWDTLVTQKMKEASLLDAVNAVTRSARITVAIDPQVLASSPSLPLVTMDARRVRADVLLDALLKGAGLQRQDRDGVATIALAPPTATATVSALKVIPPEAASQPQMGREVAASAATTLSAPAQASSSKALPDDSHLEVTFISRK